MAHESNGTIKMISMDDGVAWIAINDDTSGAPHEVANLISVLLLADMFGKTPQSVARRVIRYKNTRLLSGEGK